MTEFFSTDVDRPAHIPKLTKMADSSFSSRARCESKLKVMIEKSTSIPLNF